jgi:hypothetical protein
MPPLSKFAAANLCCGGRGQVRALQSASQQCSRRYLTPSPRRNNETAPLAREPRRRNAHPRASVASATAASK